VKVKFTTSFEEDFKKAIKKVAIDTDCNVNDVLQACYEYCQAKGKVIEIINKYKEAKQ
jgi:hypothetical protein